MKKTIESVKILIPLIALISIGISFITGIIGGLKSSLENWYTPVSEHQRIVSGEPFFDIMLYSFVIFLLLTFISYIWKD